MNRAREHPDTSDMISTEIETVNVEGTSTSSNLDNQKEWWLRLHQKDGETRRTDQAAEKKTNLSPNEISPCSQSGSSCGGRGSSVSTSTTSETAESFWVDEWQHHLHDKPPLGSCASSKSCSKGGTSVFDRLYQKSLANQQAGKEKRERIAKSREKKQHPRRTITPGYAAEMYNRLHKESMNKFCWGD